jgi:hypothetical protein
MNKYATRDFTPTWLYHTPFHCFWALSAADYITDDFGRSIEVESLVHGVDDEVLDWLYAETGTYDDTVYPQYRVVDKPAVQADTHVEFPEYRVIR